jgi:hypothetical protein
MVLKPTRRFLIPTFRLHYLHYLRKCAFCVITCGSHIFLFAGKIVRFGQNLRENKNGFKAKNGQIRLTSRSNIVQQDRLDHVNSSNSLLPSLSSITHALYSFRRGSTFSTRRPPHVARFKVCRWVDLKAHFALHGCRLMKVSIFLRVNPTVVMVYR